MPLWAKTKKIMMKKIQLIWGIALTVMGFSLLFNINNKISLIEQTGMRVNTAKFALYILAFFLIFGGIKKLITIFKRDS